MQSEKKAKDLRPQLERAQGDATAGAKDGDVTMVIFHDHNCGFCKRSIPDVVRLLDEDKKLRVVVKDFPILGPLSVEKAKASIAVAKLAPDKWVEYYKDNAQDNPQTVEQVIDMVSKRIGIDPNLLRSEMESKETLNKISENHALGEQLEIQGTPVFVINGNVVRGAAGYDAFKQMIAEARAENGKPDSIKK